MQRQDALDLLNKARLRITRTRETLIDLMIDVDSDRPFSAADLRAAAGGALDLVTIYRNLEAFSAAGVICRADLNGDPARFTLAHAGHGTHHHHHVTCRLCHRVAAVATCALEQTTRAVRRLGFRQIEHRLEFTGTCADCV